MSKSSKKRVREISNANADLIAIYEDLASETAQVRLNAALRLLSAGYSNEELAAILKRLFRGLCSSRKAARLGFSIALTEFLTRYVTSESRFTVEQILNQLEEQTVPALKEESRDYYFGRIFAVEALIKSKILLQPGQDQPWSTLVGLLLELYHKKHWLREECGWVLQQALVSLRDQPELASLARSIFEQLQDQKLLQTLEGIALRLTFRSGGFTDFPLSDIVPNDNDPFSSAERTGLLNALRKTAASDGDGQSSHNSAAAWSNKLHFAWITIFEAAWRAGLDREASPASQKENKARFTSLWTAFVEGHLFANASSEQKKYSGFLMVQHFTKEFSDPFFSSQPNFLRCFCNQLSENERHFHEIAAKTLKTILKAAQTDESKRFAGGLLVEMVGRNGWVAFDKITKSKFVEKLISMAAPEQQEACLVALSTYMEDPDRFTHGMEEIHFFTACAEFLLVLIKSYSQTQDPDGPVERSGKPVMPIAISLLTRFGFLQIYARGADQSDISEQIKSIFRARLLSALNYLMTQNDDPSIDAAYAARILLEADSSLQPPPISQFDHATIKKIKRAGKTMAKCSENINLLNGSQTVADKKLKAYQAFRLLFALFIIQAFSVDAEALPILEELEMAYNSNLGDKSKAEEGSNGVVDILLSLISKPSDFFRRVGREVFSSCTAMLDQADLDTMFDVLQKSENLAGQQELFDTENSEASQDDDSDGQAESDNEESDDEASEIVAEEDLDEVIEFENKLAQALGTRRGEEELENGANEDSDEEMMNDEQMAALDPLMSNLFKERRKASRKKDNETAKQTIVQFKTKVLELLEIYVRQEAKNQENTLLVVIPDQCLTCIQTTKSTVVSKKAANIIDIAMNVYKLNENSRQRKQLSRTAKQELQAVQARVLHPISKLCLRACSQASLLLAKIMLNNGSSIKKVWKEYSRTGEKMATEREVKVIGALFHDWFNWLTSAKLKLNTPKIAELDLVSK